PGVFGPPHYFQREPSALPPPVLRGVLPANPHASVAEKGLPGSSFSSSTRMWEGDRYSAGRRSAPPPLRTPHGLMSPIGHALGSTAARGTPSCYYRALLARISVIKTNRPTLAPLRCHPRW